jgi:hypothetical protein
VATEVSIPTDSIGVYIHTQYQGSLEPRDRLVSYTVKEISLCTIRSISLTTIHVTCTIIVVIRPAMITWIAPDRLNYRGGRTGIGIVVPLEQKLGWRRHLDLEYIQKHPSLLSIVRTMLMVKGSSGLTLYQRPPAIV